MLFQPESVVASFMHIMVFNFKVIIFINIETPVHDTFRSMQNTIFKKILNLTVNYIQKYVFGFFGADSDIF